MKRSGLLLLVFLLVSGFGCAQKVKLNKGKVSQRTYFGEVTIERARDKIIIPVEIEGETYRFLFDTGAPNLISHALSKRISGEVLSAINVRDANDKGRKMELISVPSIVIGGVEFLDTPTLVNRQDSNFILDCFGVEGIIGSNMVRRSVIHIDSERNLFQVANDPNKFGLSKQDGIEMELSKVQSSPHLWIHHEGTGKAREYVLFDTGMQGFYDMSASNYETLKDLQVFEGGEEGKGVASLGLFDNTDEHTQHRLRIDQISIGSHNFMNVPTETVDADRSRIGAAILDHGNITLDFRNGKFHFEPHNGIMDLKEQWLGFSPTIKEDSFVVGIVWDDRIKEKISYGDQILMINGIDLTGVPACDMLSRPSMFREENKFRIGFRDAETGEEFELELEKYPAR